ncbi:MAG TPA: GFA family protein [Mesorhizobium sp.]|jgi:hypothetical protein
MNYQGGCHCGKVGFSVELDLSSPITCNCSYCTQRGSILAFAPVENFSLEKGDGELTEYLFNTNKISHLFCASCGMESFARATAPDGIKMVAVNIRCLEGVDPDAVTPHRFDGRSR